MYFNTVTVINMGIIKLFLPEAVLGCWMSWLTFICVANYFFSVLILDLNSSELHFLHMVPDMCCDWENLSETPSKYNLITMTTYPLCFDIVSFLLKSCVS